MPVSSTQSLLEFWIATGTGYPVNEITGVSPSMVLFTSAVFETPTVIAGLSAPRRTTTRTPMSAARLRTLPVVSSFTRPT